MVSVFFSFPPANLPDLCVLYGSKNSILLSRISMRTGNPPDELEVLLVFRVLRAGVSGDLKAA
jgi:hypothetical protein